MGRLSCPFVTVFTTIVFITSVEGKPRTEASRDCANPEPSFEQSVKEMVGVGSDRTKGEKNVSIGNVVVATIFEEFETRLSRLERRLRAIEQPGKRGLFFFFFLSPLIRPELYFPLSLRWIGEWWCERFIQFGRWAQARKTGRFAPKGRVGVNRK